MKILKSTVTKKVTVCFDNLGEEGADFLKVVFHKFNLVHSWTLCLI